MEIEYKWEMPDALTLGALLREGISARQPLCPDEVRMHATYYDTDACDVRDMHGGLRIRRENGRSVCCLKLAVVGDDGCKVRQEFEVDAADIIEGLERLPEVGAPRELCERLAAGKPQPICETDFVRIRHEVAGDGFCAELAVDKGEMRREGRMAPIREVEFEYVAGDEDAFHAHARRMQTEYGLTPQPLSKLARAMAL